MDVDTLVWPLLETRVIKPIKLEHISGNLHAAEHVIQSNIGGYAICLLNKVVLPEK